MAPRARFELATLRLTAECSTVELPGNIPILRYIRLVFKQGHGDMTESESNAFSAVSANINEARDLAALELAEPRASAWWALWALRSPWGLPAECGRRAQSPNLRARNRIGWRPKR
jgi:hypothetical protein